MPKKVIQVPIDEDLLKALNKLSKKQHETRSELIREACRHYLTKTEQEELDKAYRRGYEETPEEPELGEAQLSISDQVLGKESW